MRQLPLAMQLRERAVFDSFVAGDNRALIDWLRGRAGETAARAASVGWLCGPAGAGKSHLLQASCALALSSGRSALYVPLSQLLGFGAGALEGWRQADLVALDELPAVIGRRDWEEALFALYRELEERGATLLVAAAVPPAALRFTLPDLASRFAAAMLLALRPLDEAAQREVLRLRARARGLTLPDDAALYLQRRYPRDLPTLCSLLDTIDSAALQAQRRLTIPFIREVLDAPADGSA